MIQRVNNSPYFHASFPETVSVFSLISKVMNLQFRSIWDKLSTVMQTNNKVNGKILVISISRRITRGSDLIEVVDGSGDTFRHLYTYKRERK